MKNILKTFNKEYPKWADTIKVDHSILGSYQHFFSILEFANPTILDYVYNDWLEDEKQEYWFYNFHKALRQGDAFVGCHVNYTIEFKLTDEDEAKFQTLSKARKESLAKIDNDDFPYSYRQWRIDNIEEERLYNTFRNKQSKSETENIGGHLDMLLWNMIHLDKSNRLQFILSGFFEDIKDGMIKIEE